ncbi:hypothetical protein [Cellulomonas denverensis]|uniref:Uncharacterized protein n=1 Tax=Cellulomonas denverensis TaxID=264297 RepID=A0A7X6QY27_9CELL|nr:hypothetical protein [Cellulomonas denverensis]NKY21742.1 hypothetical protein [Cellulomonas denverensis]GIG25599.1 hypothetical protein Cde04nite_18430 [Cellulomonas denverensis]
MGPADLVEPRAYGAGWMWLAIGLLVLVIAWLVAAWRLGRRRSDGRPEQPVSDDPLAGGTPADPYAGARARRLADLDEIGTRLAADQVEPRVAALEVAAVLREFATVRRGVKAEPLTATELRRLGWTGGTGELVAALLDPAFSAPGATPASARQAIGRAREVISRW